MDCPDSSFLQSFRAGAPEAVQRVRDLDRVVRIVAPDLERAGLVDDAVQVCAEMLAQQGRREPDLRRMTVDAFLFGLARRAVQVVREQQGAAGCRRVEQRRCLQFDRLLDVEPDGTGGGARFVRTDAAGARRPGCRRPTPSDATFDRITGRLDIEAAASTLPAPLRVAVDEIAFGDAGVSAAARAAGIARSTLQDHLVAWARSRRIAA